MYAYHAELSPNLYSTIYRIPLSFLKFLLVQRYKESFSIFPQLPPLSVSGRYVRITWLRMPMNWIFYKFARFVTGNFADVYPYVCRCCSDGRWGYAGPRSRKWGPWAAPSTVPGMAREARLRAQCPVEQRRRGKFPSCRWCRVRFIRR